MSSTVIGRGPAGMAIAAALVSEGIETRLVGPAPDHELPFGNNYGIWTDELEDLGLTQLAAHSYPETEIRIDDQRRHQLPFGYSRIDNLALRDHLARAFGDRGGVTVDAEVRAVRPNERGAEVELANGECWRSPFVVDATGHRPRFAHRKDPPVLAAQVAYGRLLRVRSHPFPLDCMRLMDLSPIPGIHEEAPSFLYAMPFGPDRVFVEETSLSARPPLVMEVLEQRLKHRLVHLEIEVVQELAIERCFIPMGAPVPRFHPTVFAFGASASMVHPATGYLLARVLRAAPRVARAVRLARSAGHPLAPAAWSALWSVRDRTVYALLRRGLEVLLRLSAGEMRDFFDAFYRRPPEEWRAYLRGDGSTPEILRAMRGVFAQLPGNLRGRVIRALI